MFTVFLFRDTRPISRLFLSCAFFSLGCPSSPDFQGSPNFYCFFFGSLPHALVSPELFILNGAHSAPVSFHPVTVWTRLPFVSSVCFLSLVPVGPFCFFASPFLVVVSRHFLRPVNSPPPSSPNCSPGNRSLMMLLLSFPLFPFPCFVLSCDRLFIACIDNVFYFC